MTEEQIRAVKGKRLLNEPFGDELVIRKWGRWADDTELNDAIDACSTERAPVIRGWLVEERTLRAEERRHRESLAVDRSARNAAWYGVGLSAFGILVGVASTLLVQKFQELPTYSQSPSEAESSPLFGSTSVSHSSDLRDDNAASGNLTTPTAQPTTPTSHEPKSDKPPRLQK
jgi:hypothetical protein